MCARHRSQPGPCQSSALALAVALLGVAARAPAAELPDYPFCEIVREVEERPFGPIVGHLCVIRPTTTDTPGSGIFDLDPDCTREDGECVSGDGYGFHVVGIPATMSPESPVSLVISGAYGAPFSPITQEHLGIEPGEAEGFYDLGDVRYLATLRDAMATGHLVLQVAYRNPGSVNRDFCDFGGDFDDVDPHPASNPHCHYLLRTLQLDGVQQCPPTAPGCEPIPAFDLSPDGTLDLANAYYRRLDLLVAYLRAQPLSWPAALEPFDWSALRLVGHSQGSGHAYLIATLRERVARACFLAGPRDFDRVENDYASWFRPYPLTTLTPKSDMRGLVSESDAAGAIGASWRHLFLQPGVHTQVVNDSPPGRVFGNGHEEIIADPFYTFERQQACFSDSGLPLPPSPVPLPGWTIAMLGTGILTQRFRQTLPGPGGARAWRSSARPPSSSSRTAT